MASKASMRKRLKASYAAQAKPRHQFKSVREAALAVLNINARLTTADAKFLGQLTVQRGALSEPQRAWLNQLLLRSHLPPYK